MKPEEAIKTIKIALAEVEVWTGGMKMKYKATILRLKQYREELRSQEEYELAEVIDDAISIIDLHNPEPVVVIQTPMGSALVCPNCGGQICHTDMMCPICTKLIDWEGIE